MRPLPLTRMLTCTALLPAALLLSQCSASVPAGTDATADPFSQPVVPGEVSVDGAPTPAEDTSVDPDVAALRHGSGDVHVMVVDGAFLPESVTRAFTEATGFTVRATAFPDSLGAASSTDADGADVWFGLDATDATEAAATPTILRGTGPEDARSIDGAPASATPKARVYGTDDVCVLADRAWFSANGLALPASLDEVGAQAARLAVPDPTGSAVGRSFAQLTSQVKGGDAPAWVQALRGQASVGAWDSALAEWTAGAGVAAAASSAVDTDEGEAVTGQSASVQSGAAEASGTRPLLVAPLHVVAQAVTNTGVESVAEPVPGTCVDRALHLGVAADPTNEDGAEAFVAFLLTGTGQRLLAEAGAVAPADSAAGEGTAAEWFLAPAGDAVAVSAAESTAEGVEATLAAWR